MQDIRERTKGMPQPKVMWGDIYEKRVLVEPGNAWVAELIGLAQSDYLFNNIYSTSCIEISTERFIHSGKDADLYFTYRTPDRGATSKAALARYNPPLSTKAKKSSLAIAPRADIVIPNHREKDNTKNRLLA